MMIILPPWVSEFEKKISDMIADLCNEENINFGLTQDSQTIKNAINSITMTLFNIQEKAEGNVPKEFHEERKKMIKIEGNKLIKRKYKKHKRKYPEEMAEFLRLNINKAKNSELVDLVKDRFGVRTTVPRLTNYLFLKGIKRDKKNGKTN